MWIVVLCNKCWVCNFLLIEWLFKYFQVEAIHSGSISFGRFELESLSWERRSSFSHNRYLEEVEKYARPGSVTEKKAYFEAHFRRKALLRQAEKEGSPSENGSYESTTYEENNDRNWCPEEESQHIHQNSDACHFDESSEDSYCYEDVSGIEGGAGLTGYGHSEARAETIDVDIASHFDESSDDSVSSGAHQRGEFEEEAEATAHSDLQLESAVNSVDLETAARCCDNEGKFKSESKCKGSVTNNVPLDVQVEIIPKEQGPEVTREEDISYCTEAMDSASEILENHALKVYVLLIYFVCTFFYQLDCAYGLVGGLFFHLKYALGACTPTWMSTIEPHFGLKEPKF